MDHVCSIGTYNRMKIKSALKDFARVKKLNFKDVNFATREIPDALRYYWSDIFENGIKKKKLRDFIQSNVEICEVLRPAMNQPKSASIHASAVLIFPKHDREGNPMTVYDWLPVKKVDGVLVSEWEGKYVDIAGFLKEDLLGLSQLDKFKMILENIKINKGKKVNLNKIPMHKEEVYEFFQEGWTEDIFQFGGGLKSYSKMVKPDSIEDLIAMNALYRPGPMESNSHTNFALIKHGKKEADFDKGMEKITSKTNGLYVYQEQIMQAMVVGGLTLVQSDEVRTIMKKKDFEAMEAFKEIFLETYGKIVGGKELAQKTWDKLFSFSAYGFNRSHSAAYSMMSYWSQYLKVKYPLEFWTASLNFANEDDYSIPNRLSEMDAIKGDIEVRQPDVNKSDIFFTCYPDTNTIYWSLTKIKSAGDVAISTLLAVRKEGGEFFDMDDFLSRVPKNKVNKKVVTNLILAGAFDQIGGAHGLPIDNFRDRLQIMQTYYEKIKTPIPADILENKNHKKNWFWILKQKEITGFGNINYRELIERKLSSKVTKNFISPEDFVIKKVYEKWGDPCIIAGMIVSIKTRTYKKGTMCNLMLESNNSIIPLVFWDEIYSQYITKLPELMETKQLVAITGVIRFDTFKGKNILMSDENTKIHEI